MDIPKFNNKEELFAYYSENQDSMDFKDYQVALMNLNKKVDEKVTEKTN